MNAKVRLFSLFIGSIVVAAILFFLPSREPQTLFDAAFETFGLSELAPCPGYTDQVEIFQSERDHLPNYSEEERKILEAHWNRFLASEMGSRPSPCEWTISSYPSGFIASDGNVLIVINPSQVVMGVPLPIGATGDLVMDAARYTETSLGAFRGSATIPPKMIAVIALR